MMKVTLFIALLALCGCTSQIVVPPVSTAQPFGMDKVKGNYLVYIQTGGWNLDASRSGMTCPLNSFTADLNTPYESAIKSAISSGLEKVSFSSAISSPDELSRGGYDAHVVVHQGNAEANFGVQERFLGADSVSGVDLTTIIAVVKKNGTRYQQTVTGSGFSKAGVFFCGDAGDSLGPASAAAINDIVTKSLLYIRDGIRQ